MARKYELTEKRIARWKKEGRGAGIGAHYKPWLTTADVPSRGRSHRVLLPKTGRQHHFFSDNEYYAFLTMAFDEDVVDIREQFPLDREETQAIAAAINVRHPVQNGIPIVMTTDFVETRLDGRSRTDRAIAIKPDEDLENERTVEKLEIERIYWARREVPWFIGTSSRLKNATTFNLEWIFDNSLEADVDLDRYYGVFLALPNALEIHEQRPLREMATWLDGQMNCEPGECLAIIRRLLSTKQVTVDLSKPTLPDQPCSIFSAGDQS